MRLGPARRRRLPATRPEDRRPRRRGPQWRSVPIHYQDGAPHLHGRSGPNRGRRSDRRQARSRAANRLPVPAATLFRRAPAGCSPRAAAPRSTPRTPGRMRAGRATRHGAARRAGDQQQADRPGERRAGEETDRAERRQRDQPDGNGYQRPGSKPGRAAPTSQRMLRSQYRRKRSLPNASRRRSGSERTRNRTGHPHAPQAGGFPRAG